MLAFVKVTDKCGVCFFLPPVCVAEALSAMLSDI